MNNTEDWSIVEAKNFIKATRSSGYTSTVNAVAELIDNAIQANASEIVIHFATADKEKHKRSRQVERIFIVDNGSGMSPQAMRQALRFGGSSRFDDRSGLGRFGMGLPNASFSQCKHLALFSRQPGEEQFYFTYICVNEIASGRMRFVPEPKPRELIDDVDCYAIYPHGTIVCWDMCDKLDYDGRDASLKQALCFELGQKFRYFLQDGLKIIVDGSEVDIFDPLFRMPEARYSGVEKEVQMDVRLPHHAQDGLVARVTVVLFPADWQLSDSIDKALKDRIHKRKTGFSIVRGRREIDCGLFGFRQEHWVNTYWSGEIIFEPEFDELYGITHTKQQVVFAEALKEELKRVANELLPPIRREIEARSRKANAEIKTVIAEEIVDSFKKQVPQRSNTDKSLVAVQHEIDACMSHATYLTTTEKATRRSRLEEANRKKVPYIISFEKCPDRYFYWTNEVGNTKELVINQDHPFFEMYYKPLSELSESAHVGMELLLIAMSQAMEHPGIENQCLPAVARVVHEWDKILRLYLTAPQTKLAKWPKR